MKNPGQDCLEIECDTEWIDEVLLVFLMNFSLNFITNLSFLNFDQVGETFYWLLNGMNEISMKNVSKKMASQINLIGNDCLKDESKG